MMQRSAKGGCGFTGQPGGLVGYNCARLDLEEDRSGGGSAAARRFVPASLLHLVSKHGAAP